MSQGRDTIGFVNEARKLVSQKVQLPKGYSIAWAGQYENQKRASNRLLLLIPLALLINIFIIFLAIKNWSQSLVVFSAVPIAFFRRVNSLVAGWF